MKWCIICLLPLIALALASHQYHYVAGPKTWTEAQTYCRENYNDLATISDKEEMQILNELSLNLSISGGVWIGLYNKLHNWSSEFEYFSRDTNYCLYLCRGSIWHPMNCNNEFHFVCYNESAPHGFNIILRAFNWTEAQRYCQKIHTRLATISVRNQEQINYLLNISFHINMDPYGDGWMWSNGSTPSFINWLDNSRKYLNSSKRCVASMQTPENRGGWETQRCTEGLPFFCMSTKKTEPVKRRQIVRVDLQVDSLEVNTPEVQEVILHQIKAKLQKNGLPEEAILSWIKHPDGQIFHEKKEKREKEEGRSKDEF